MQVKRQKVKLQCKKCGEIYTLRGKMDKFGHVETGLKRCICDNENEFRVIVDEI